MKYEIIDNFLPKDEFERLQTFVMSGNFDWYWNKSITFPENSHHDENTSSCFTHNLFTRNFDYTLSGFYKQFFIIEQTLEVKALIRMKANLYPSTKELVTHATHSDYDYQHKGCIFSINTCDGGTILEDGEMINSVANRALLFDPSKPHSSTSCTDKKARININVNYF